MSVTKVPNELLSDPHIGVGITDTATSAKLAVSNTGIDVTGEVQASSFVMDDSNNTDRWELLRDGNDFTIYNDYPSQSERFRITSGGSVGIGTNPLQKLHIDTGASGLPAIRLSHTNTGADNFDITAGTPGVSNSGFTIRDVDAAANRLTITSTGNVGIGTSSPDVNSALEVNGRVRVATGSTGLPALSGFADLDTGFSFPGSNVITTSTAGSERMRITSTGNVEMSGVLNLTGTDNAHGIDINNANGRLYFSGKRALEGGTNLSIGEGFPTGNIDLGSRLLITSTGNVEMGGNLDVDGAVNSTGEMRITNPSADSQLYLYGASGYKANIILNEYGVRAWHIGAGTYTSGQFSISDGTTESLRITSTGKVGIGTTNPAYPLVVSHGGAGGMEFGVSTSATNIFQNYNRSTSTYNSVKYIASSHQFNVSGAGTNDMTIAGGVVLINRTFAGFGERLSVNGGTGGYVIHTEKNTTGAQGHIVFSNPNGAVGSIFTNGSATSYNTSSDYRLKENVAPMSGSIDRLKSLKPSRFNFITDASKTVDGFLAHEAGEVVPEAITGEKDGMKMEEYEVTPAVMDGETVITEAVMGEREVPDMQGIDQAKLVPLLVGAIQELTTRLEALENK